MADLDLAALLPTDEDGVGDGIASPDLLSGSSVNTFLRCGKQWEYAYVLRLKRPPSIKQGLGIAAHAAVEHNMAQKMLTYQDLSIEEVVAKFADSWETIAGDIEDVLNEERVNEHTGKKSKTRKETKAQAKDSGIKAVSLYQDSVAKGIQPIWVERQIQFQIDGIDWSGIVDLADAYNRVRDHKFVSRKPDGAGPYMLSMVGYALGFRHATGEQETEVVLDYVVRTAEPYYMPMPSGGPISDSAIRDFAGIVRSVHQSVAAGIFLPNGLNSFACSWCGYNDICPAYRATKGGRNA